MTTARIVRLTLSNFRNYHAATLAVDARPIVLYGPNGAGKTNLIEAISFLAPGRGLRRATLEEVACNEGDGSWAIAAQVEGALGLTKRVPRRLFRAAPGPRTACASPLCEHSLQSRPFPATSGKILLLRKRRCEQRVFAGCQKFSPSR